jgi:pimeloyl-ACP methyl ester carboxylesterase
MWEFAGKRLLEAHDASSGRNRRRCDNSGVCRNSRAARADTGVCPLYLLTGEYDFSCTPEDTMRTAAAIGGASVTIMERLGHFPMSENPEQFRRYIAPVLGRILKQSTSTKQGEHA